MKLTRIFINNYKCFTDFSLTLDSINLFLGPNGSGKSSIFQVLRKLNGFVALQMQARDLFFRFESTRWSQQGDQQFGVEIEEHGHHYQYQLTIKFDKSDIPFVCLEQLLVDKAHLVSFENEKVNLVGQAPYPLESSRSAISSIPSSSAPAQLLTFRQLFSRILIVQVVPPIMEGVSSEETAYLWPDSRNWVSWYRFNSQDQSYIGDLKEHLGDIFPGFSHFHFVDIGTDSAGKNSKGLLINFATSQEARRIGYSFTELSDGQRALVALYALLVYAKRQRIILCVDEPENFLALAEIQPWLVELYEACSKDEIQALLVSHHPEIINFLGTEAGVWFERTDSGSVATYPVVDEADTGLSISELVARGWIGDKT